MPRGVRLDIVKAKVFPDQVERVTRAYRRALEIAADSVIIDYEKTTATWSTPVRWTVKIARDHVEVYTKSQIYEYVDRGTRPHPIYPRRARLLRFQVGYRAKTRVGSIVSGPGGKFGPYVVARAVMHPGTRARGFSTRLRQKWKRKWPKLLNTEIAHAI